MATAKQQRDWKARNPKKMAEYQRRYRAKNVERIRNYYVHYSRRRLYGIDASEYAALFAKQEGKCPICGTAGRKLAVDHDHRTGQVRGLLCSTCNSGLGMFKDDPARLKAALLYLSPKVNAGPIGVTSS